MENDSTLLISEQMNGSGKTLWREHFATVNIAAKRQGSFLGSLGIRRQWNNAIIKSNQNLNQASNLALWYSYSMGLPL